MAKDEDDGMFSSSAESISSDQERPDVSFFLQGTGSVILEKGESRKRREKKAK